MEVTFEKVGRRYGNVDAVRDLNLTIPSGALQFLLGPSGCGKTTTLRMLAGLEPPSSGRILFDGRDVTNLPAAERGIGMVFQNYALWPHMTVRGNIEYGLKLKKLAADEMRRRMEEVLSLTQLTSFAERYPGQLSGGQQQRVALARALAIRPNVLLLDEPLSNLDAKLRLEMRENISRIHRQTGITTVYVTHDQKEALSMGTHVSIMRAGLLVQTDSPRRLYHHPKTPFIAGFIGETNLIDGQIKAMNQGEFTVETAMGVLFASRAEGSFKVNDAVALSIRPEAIRVDFNGSGISGDNVRELPLDHLTYLGESEQLLFKKNNGKLLKANAFNPPEHTLKPSDLVKFAIAKDDILLLPREADLSSGT